MSLKTFLYAVDALMVEEGIRFHVETEGTEAPAVPSSADVKARNDQAMAAFSAMMGGVQKGRGRRR